MKTLMVLSFIACLAQGDSMQDVKPKAATTAQLNTIASVQKTDTYQPIRYYQTMLQHLQQQQPQYVPVQVVPKQYYMPQPQPHAMIIIAQPTYVPQSLLYPSPTQQLLNYFHSNPQAKYQLLHGNYQPQVAPNYHQQAAAPSIGNYIIAAPHPQAVVQPVVQQVAPQPIAPSALPHNYHHLGHIAQIAQLAAQQYAPPAPIRSTPAFIAGLENFTPEQQAQIRTQLRAHLGNNFHTISGKTAAPVQPELSTAFPAQKYHHSPPADFIPNQQVKTDAVNAANTQTESTNNQ